VSGLDTGPGPSTPSTIRLFDPRDTNQTAGPFVIGKLAQDGVEVPTSVVYGEGLSRSTNMTAGALIIGAPLRRATLRKTRVLMADPPVPTLEGAAAYLFAGIHPERLPFGLGIAFDRALTWTGATRFCVANSAVKAATFCSVSASVAVVSRICPISSFSAVLSIHSPSLGRRPDGSSANCLENVNEVLT
jgi:hypothetical protein